MPTVKSNTGVSTESKEAGAAAKAARLKIIEGSVAKVLPSFQASADAVEAANQSYFDCFEAIQKEVTKHSFDKVETGKLLAVTLAKVYTEGDESAVSSNPTANTLKSKFVRLCHPATPKAAKELAKALEKGVNFNNALEIARGNKTASEVAKKGKTGGARTKGGNNIDDEDSFGDFLSALIARALDGGEDHPKYKGGLDMNTIEEKASEVIAGFRAKLDGEADESETEKDND